MTEAKKSRRKIAILGTSPSWKDAPPGWEVWVCNRAGLAQKPWDRLFEIHRNWDYESPEARDRYLDDLKAVKPPQQVISVVPLAGPANLVIDREALFKKYGAIWFSSSFGYMVAHALEQKATDIGFWGIELESIEEYIVQFAGLRHFIEIAKLLGVKIHIPERCMLRREPHPYPDRFETIQAHTYETKVSRLEDLIESVETSLEEARGMHQYEQGCLSEMDWHDEKRRKRTRKRANEHALFARRFERSLYQLKGELTATQYYQRMFVFNALPPSIGDETGTDTENCGPI